MEAAITAALSYIQPKSEYDLDITIFSDDAYHSQDPPLANSPKLRFHSHSLPIHEVPKTGLGSSAALTTVVTAALIGFYYSSQKSTTPDKFPRVFPSKLDPTSRDQLNIIHNLAQIAHSTAQRKIGSGFDVGSAVYGSIVYRRFPTDAIASLIDLGTSIDIDSRGGTVSSESFCKALVDLVDSPHSDPKTWAPLQHEPCSMPPGISLLMGDVKGGSETPKLVSHVLQWRKNKPQEANELWGNLNKANMTLVKTLDDLRTLFEKDAAKYTTLLDKHAAITLKKRSTVSSSSPSSSSSSSNTSPVATPIDTDESGDDLIFQLKKDIANIRKYLKQMTILSGVPIEPDSQTELLDRCVGELPGVLGGVVPGAGGYDAISLVVISKSVDEIKSVSKRIGRGDNTKPLPITWLELREQSRGLVEENFNNSDYTAFF